MNNPDYPELLANDAGDFRPTGIRNLSPGLVERGKIKIGEKGAKRTSNGGKEWQPPVKLDHFLVTSMERGLDGNFLHDKDVMAKLGDKPREIPIQLVYDDINLNFPSRYACYIGKTLWCSGDGQQARRANTNEQGVLQPGHHLVQCPCPRQDPTYTGSDKCKITGTLSAVITGADVVGGVWKFRTTSYNSVVGILSSLAMIKRITGGRLAGIPLVMKLSPKAVTDPVKGSQQTIYVVSVEYRGSVQALRTAGYLALREDKEHGVKIELLEDQARVMLAERRDEFEDDADDVVAEFFPEQAAAAAGVTLASHLHQGKPEQETTTAATQASQTRSFASYAPAADVTDVTDVQDTSQAAEKPAAAKTEPEQQAEPAVNDNKKPAARARQAPKAKAEEAAPPPAEDPPAEKPAAATQSKPQADAAGFDPFDSF